MRLRLCTIGKTQLCVHLATPLFMLYMVLSGSGMLLLAGFASILLHEAGHALCAAAFGHPPEEVELTPLGCLLRLEDEAALPLAPRLLTILAGPAVTALLALLAVRLTAAGCIDRALGRMLFGCNMGLLAINLLPALPLDGGRLASLLLSLLCPMARVRQAMRISGTVLGMAMIAANAAVCLRYGGWNLSLMCAGCFLIYAAGMAGTAAALEQLQQLMDRKARLELRGVLPAVCLAVTTVTPLSQAVKRLHPARYTELILLEPGTLRRAGRAGEEQLIAAWLDSPGETCRILTRGASPDA